MNVIIPIESETLTAEELESLTGRPRAREQLVWLKENGWRYETNASGYPIVGRLYTRFKLAGVDLAATATPAGPAPDFKSAR